MKDLHLPKEIKSVQELVSLNDTDEGYYVPVNEEARRAILRQNIENLEEYIQFCDDEDKYDDAMDFVDEYMKDKR